jgi:Second Messenger Oligonucleotide or Dinucleotide Synthetase domain/tRNA nucleotidyltransferase, second domain
MPLKNHQLKAYDADVLRLPQDKRTEYHAQVDRLIKNLKDNLKATTAIKISRVVKAGSFAKFTILRKTSDDNVDADVVFYVCGDGLDQETLGGLNDLIHQALTNAYPTKQVEDFEIQRRAATVTFVGTGLSVDIVPVVEDPDRPGYGWQFDREDGSKLLTCAPCAIQFVRDRKNQDPDFRTLVRLAKRWRNHVELKRLKSFVIELIMAHVLEVCGREGTIEQRFRNFLMYIAQSGLKEVIAFPENVGIISRFTDPVVIIDPVCNSNNVASRLSEAERLEIVAAAQEAWETAHFASIEGDLDVWKEIFGRRFKVEEAA